MNTQKKHWFSMYHLKEFRRGAEQMSQWVRVSQGAESESLPPPHPPTHTRKELARLSVLYL